MSASNEIYDLLEPRFVVDLARQSASVVHSPPPSKDMTHRVELLELGLK